MSLLCPLSRLVERLICNQIVKYLERNGLYHSMTHGYRKSHSCATSIMEMYDQAMMAYEDGNFFGLNLFDQSSAFDLVDFKIFQQKLELLGFDKDSREWFKSFLENRRQYVHVEAAPVL